MSKFTNPIMIGGAQAPRHLPLRPDLMSVKEAADYLRVCEKTIRTHIAKGTLKAGKIGKQFRISRRDIDAYLGRSNNG